MKEINWVQGAPMSGDVVKGPVLVKTVLTYEGPKGSEKTQTPKPQYFHSGMVDEDQIPVDANVDLTGYKEADFLVLAYPLTVETTVKPGDDPTVTVTVISKVN